MKIPKLPELERLTRNCDGTLERAKEELRDAYMQFKDLEQRCKLNLASGDKFAQQEEPSVLYFKPETFLLEDPEKQRLYREALLKQVSTVPKPEGLGFFADELHRAMCQSVADQSPPPLTKQVLSRYFTRRHHQLQHMKYKLLCRWAHHNLTSESIELTSSDATFLFGKLEVTLDHTTSRAERLSRDDLYESYTPEQRPSTKSNKEAALFVEHSEVAPCSLIREDDIEVFLRGTAYRNKVNKTFNKLISRLKWQTQRQKYAVFEKTLKHYFQAKRANIKQQKDALAKVSLQGLSA
jgi:hypothetical protein